ncbi:MAG: hypothetical protein ABIO24_09180 [Saprospiraceae bacterium]
MPLPFVWGLLQGNLLSETGLIHCDVVFGSPRSDCSGAGICKIVDINSNQQPQLKRTCRLAPALLTADAAGNTLTMTFLRQFMCVHLLRHHFRTGILKVQDACAIPERVVEKMGLSGSAIVPGHYTIEENRWGFKILFSV